MTNIDPLDRNPLRTVAGRIAKITAVAAALLTSVVGFGIITAVQGDAVTGLLGLIPGLLTAVGTIVAALSTARAGEKHVTPLVDPRTDGGTRLVPDLPFPTR